MGRLFHFGFDPMTHDEQAFFKAMGARIADLGKESSITQVQLAKTMDVSQQSVTSWEVGRRGVPVSALPTLARALGVGVEALAGETAQPAKRGPTPKLQAASRAPRPPPEGTSSVWSCRCLKACSTRQAANKQAAKRAMAVKKVHEQTRGTGARMN